MLKKILIILAPILLALFLFLAAIWFWPLPAGRTNFLVLGIAGKGYAGEDLTDTMVFVSIDNQDARTLLLSLPRDIWIAPLRTKLNAVYHYKGLEETKKTVSGLIGQPVDYGVVVDLEIFKKIVDFFGGIEINVENSFDDLKYPIAGKERDLCGGGPEFSCRYERVHFEKGINHFDGEMTLKYVRSRNAVGDEGTDFAREKRQQQVMVAIKNKIFSPGFLSHPKSVIELFNLVSANIKTDFNFKSNYNLLRTGLRFRNEKLKTVQLDGNLLINPTSEKQKYDNQWVLIPSGNDWNKIQEYVAGLLQD